MTHPKARARALAIMLSCVAMTALLFAGSASAASRGYRLHNKGDETLKLIGASRLPTVLCNGTSASTPSTRWTSRAPGRRLAAEAVAEDGGEFNRFLFYFT